MKSTAALLLGFLQVATGTPQAYRQDATSGALLPNQAVTPGAVRTTDAGEICDRRFSTKRFRHTTAIMKRRVYDNYGVEPHRLVCGRGCEVDHLVPLELGGADVVANLWPQPAWPAPGFHEKDKLENYLKMAVCADLITIVEAQTCIMGNWWQCGAEHGLWKKQKKRGLRHYR